MPTKKPKPKKPPPQKGKITPQLFDEILLWYANHGPRHTMAAEEFGLARRTLTGLYFSGYPKYNKPPMKALVKTTEVKARALRANMKREELEAANKKIESIIHSSATASELADSLDDAVRARAEEGAVVASGRRNILTMQQSLEPLLRGMATRMKTAERDFREMKGPELLKHMRELMRLQSDLMSASKINMEMERLLLGAGGDSDGKVGSMSKQQANQVFGQVARQVARMKARGEMIESEGEEVERTTVPVDDDDQSAVFDPDAVDDEADDDEEAVEREEDDEDDGYCEAAH